MNHLIQAQLSFQGKLEGKTAGAGIFATEGALITMNGELLAKIEVLEEVAY
ncbi:MAG: hypothetical protein ACK5L6_14120 [Anaerorhabdus sp.]|uniref:hypothetical protein n=1 Tax=Anaerorhabdus sp. TaxID=1872524 RepID=UPI003A8773F3